MSGGVLGIIPGAQCPVPSQGCCPESPVPPGSLAVRPEGADGPGSLTKIPTASAAQPLTGRKRHGRVRRVLPRHPRPRRGAERRRRPAPPRACPGGLPSSGGEGVNLQASQRECGAINTHSQAVCQWSRREQGAGSQLRSEPGPEPRLRGPELFSGTAWAPRWPHLVLAHLGAAGPDPRSWRPPTPPTPGGKNKLSSGNHLCRRAVWTGKSRRLDRQMNRCTGHHPRACAPGPGSDRRQPSGQPGGRGLPKGQRGALLDLCLPASDL